MPRPLSRRPAAKLFTDLKPVLRTDIDTIIGDLSAAARKDGPSSKPNSSASSNSPRNVKGRRWDRSVLEFLELVASFGPLWELSEQVEALIDASPGPRKPGREREYRVIEVFIFAVAVWVYRSHTAAHDNFSDPKNWERLRSAVRERWGALHPDRELSPHPMTRHKHYRFRKRFKGYVDDHLLVVMKRLITDMSVEGALFIGLFNPEAGDSLAHPDSTRMLTGDGTWLRAPYNVDAPMIDPRTGQVRRRDATAVLYHGNDAGLQFKPCHQAVIVSGRNLHPNERVVLFAGVMPPEGVLGTRSDATMAVQATLQLLDEHEALRAGVRGMAYDMQMDSEDKDDLLDSGLTYTVKSRITSRRKAASRVLGPLRFVHKDGTKSKHVVTAIADTPCLSRLVGNKQVVQPLRRVTLERKRRKRERAWTIYGIFEVPDTEVVPRELVGACVRIPHNSTKTERETVPYHTRRTRALSPIPESDPWFDEIYGIREDSESINSDIKSRLPHGRCRTPGAENLTFELLAYQLMVLIKALNSYCRRTGADSTRWFGQQPPAARAGPLPLAA